MAPVKPGVESRQVRKQIAAQAVLDVAAGIEVSTRDQVRIIPCTSAQPTITSAVQATR
jgi:hypothetical protein